jgi:hypothetical protein
MVGGAAPTDDAASSAMAAHSSAVRKHGHWFAMLDAITRPSGSEGDSMKQI